MPEELRASLVVEYIVVQTGRRTWKLARANQSVWGTTFEVIDDPRYPSEQAAHAERKRRAAR